MNKSTNMSSLKSSPVVHLLYALVFFVSGLIVNLLQVLCFIILWPVNKELFRKINYFFSYIISSGTYYNIYIHVSSYSCSGRFEVVPLSTLSSYINHNSIILNYYLRITLSILFVSYNLFAQCKFHF